MHFQKGFTVKHPNFGLGTVLDICDDRSKVQVVFDKEPPKPSYYKFSSNPYVVPVDQLEPVNIKGVKL